MNHSGFIRHSFLLIVSILTVYVTFASVLEADSSLCSSENSRGMLQSTHSNPTAMPLECNAAVSAPQKEGGGVAIVRSSRRRKSPPPHSEESEQSKGEASANGRRQHEARLKRRRIPVHNIANLFNSFSRNVDLAESDSSRDGCVLAFVKLLYRRLTLAPRRTIMQEVKLPFSNGTLNDDSSAIPGDDELTPNDYWTTCDAARRISGEIHSDIFIQLITLTWDDGRTVVGEGVLVEYLHLLRELFPNPKDFFPVVRFAVLPALKRSSKWLLRALLDSIQDRVDSSIGKDLLVHHLKYGINYADMVEYSDWQNVTVYLISKFGKVIHDNDLRLRGLSSAEVSARSPALFMHFGPLLRLLQLENYDAFKAEREHFEKFFSFQIRGHHRANIYLEQSGLLTLNALVGKGRVAVTTFIDEATWEFRAKCVTWMLRNAFQTFSLNYLVGLFYTERAHALLELTLVYALNRSEIDAGTLLQVIFNKPKLLPSDTLTILMLVTYCDIHEDAWLGIKQNLPDGSDATKDFDMAYVIYKAAIDYSSRHGGQIDDISIQMNSLTEAVSDVAYKYMFPVELDFMRLVLARRAGIPLCFTDYNLYFSESMEWEAVATFAQEYLRRIATLLQKEDLPAKVVIVPKL